MDKDSEVLLKLFSKELRQRFSKVKSYFVGKEARRLFDEGIRLTASVNTPIEYDLKRE